MSDLPQKVIQAAFDGDWRQPVGVIRRAMDPALGSDRLVVAGPHEQEARADQTRMLAEEVDAAMARMRNPEHRQVVEAVRELIGRFPGGERS